MPTSQELLEESRRLEQIASKETGIAPVLVGPTVTGKDLVPAPSIQFQAPTFREPFPVRDIPIPELPPTETEKEVTDLSKQIQKAQEMLLGQSVFRTEQERTLGVEGLRKTQLDLTNQLKSLQAEAEATRISPEFEQKATLQPFAEGERARKLRDVGVRALIVGANLQATHGNLAAALDQVDRAIVQKFGPVKEEIGVKMANLDLIIKSPEFTREQKERAEQQKVIQQNELRKIGKQEELADSILNTAVKAAKAGMDSITLREIQRLAENPTSENLIRADELAAPFLKKVEFAPGDIGEFQRLFGRTPSPEEFLNFKKQEAEAGRKPVESITTLPADTVASRLNSVGLNPAIITTGNKLTKGNADKIAAKGVPPSIVELITKAVLEGNTLDEIRNALAEGHGRDVGFGYLDKYMSTLQEKETKGTKLDQLLESL